MFKELIYKTKKKTNKQTKKEKNGTFINYLLLWSYQHDYTESSVSGFATIITTIIIIMMIIIILIHQHL